jgi:hypothetical protein
MDITFVETPNARQVVVRISKNGSKTACDEWSFGYDQNRHTFRPYTYRKLARVKTGLRWKPVEYYTTTGNSGANTLLDMPAAPNKVVVASFKRWSSSVTKVGFSD